MKTMTNRKRKKKKRWGRFWKTTRSSFQIWKPKKMKTLFQSKASNSMAMMGMKNYNPEGVLF